MKFCDKRNILNLVNIFRISALKLKSYQHFNLNKINLFLKNQLLVVILDDDGKIKKLFKLLKKHLFTTHYFSALRLWLFISQMFD
jgi:hypothetical protein